MRINNSASKIAVVLIDMQEFFLKRIEKAIVKEMVRNQSTVINFCASHKIPVIVLEYEGVGRGKTISPLQQELKKTPTIVIRKPHNSGFRDTDLDDVLKKLKVKKLVLMGINANGCVQDTAIGALFRRYDIATARGVIANQYSKRNENLVMTKKWFSANGKFFESPADLIGYIQKTV